jgi:HSP20 family protein
MIRENIWNELNRLEQRMEKLFSGFLFDSPNNKNEMIDALSTDYRKAFTNFKETEKEYLVQVELPGIEKNEIELNITDTGIEVKAEKRKEEKTEKEKEYSYTKKYAGFYQNFDVPDNADLENIEANHENGILTIRIPKKISTKNKKTIQIK